MLFYSIARHGNMSCHTFLLLQCHLHAETHTERGERAATGTGTGADMYTLRPSALLADAESLKPSKEPRGEVLRQCTRGPSRAPSIPRCTR